MDTGGLPSVDGETQKGCEQTTLASLGQGPTGGSISAGRIPVPDGEAPLVLGGRYYVRYKGQLQRFTLVSIHDFQDAVTLENGIGPITTKRGELIPEAVHALALFTAKQKEFEVKYREAIAFWKAGENTHQKLSKALNIPPMQAGRIVKLLQKYLLIDVIVFDEDLNETSQTSHEPRTDT